MYFVLEFLVTQYNARSHVMLKLLTSGDYENGATHQFAQQVPMQYHQKYSSYTTSVPVSTRGGGGPASNNHCLPSSHGASGPVPMSGDTAVGSPATSYNNYNRMCPSSSNSQLPPIQTQNKSISKPQRMVEKSVI